jgi:hypothetical protein
MKKETYFLGFFFVLFCFCSNKKSDIKISNESLKISFIQKGLKSPMTISCAVLNSNEFDKSKHFKFINDNGIINEFEELCSKLSINDEQNDIDVRIKIIYSHDYKNDTICMGEFFNISVNGVVMKENKEFHDYIKKIIDYENTLRHPITGKMIPKDMIGK